MYCFNAVTSLPHCVPTTVHNDSIVRSVSISSLYTYEEGAPDGRPSVLSPLLGAGAADEPAGGGVRVRAVLDDARAVHPDIAHADRELVRRFKRRAVRDRRGVED